MVYVGDVFVLGNGLFHREIMGTLCILRGLNVIAFVPAHITWNSV